MVATMDITLAFGLCSNINLRLLSGGRVEAPDKGCKALANSIDVNRTEKQRESSPN